MEKIETNFQTIEQLEINLQVAESNMYIHGSLAIVFLTISIIGFLFLWWMGVMQHAFRTSR